MKNYNYFDMFVKMADFSCQAAHLLHEIVVDFDPNTLKEKIKDMHEIEHTADMAQHDLMSRLAREFITPIDREDIIHLAQEIDNVTDTIEDVLLRMYMFNITVIRPGTLEFIDVIVQCCDALKQAMEDFHNFRKSETVQTSIIEINRLEEVGDTLYTDAIRDLYVNVKEPIAIMAWTDAFYQLERCCDACEHVADALESIRMKNS